MFLRPDEHIIIMEDDFYNPFDDDDIKMLIDAGIKTIHVPHAICWDKIYNQNSSIRDWSSLDNSINQYLKHDLKLILPFYYTMPRWFPADWYIDNTKQNPDEVVPNYANDNFKLEVSEFADEVLNHLNDIRYKVQLTYAIPSLGEFLWDNIYKEPFPVSDDVIHNFIIDVQRTLVTQHGEVWLYFHNFLGGIHNWNNIKLPLLYETLKDKFKGHPIYSVQFAHFVVGTVSTNLKDQSLVKKYRDEYGIQFLVGSQYCEGLSSNFDVAMEQNVRGFLTCPVMSFFEKNGHIQSWMVNSIKQANKRFEEMKYDPY